MGCSFFMLFLFGFGMVCFNHFAFVKDKGPTLSLLPRDLYIRIYLSFCKGGVNLEYIFKISLHHVSLNFFFLLGIKEIIWVNNDTLSSNFLNWVYSALALSLRILCIRKVLFYPPKSIFKMKLFSLNVHLLWRPRVSCFRVVSWKTVFTDDFRFWYLTDKCILVGNQNLRAIGTKDRPWSVIDLV